MAARRIVIIGGGSNAWAPNLVKDMLLTPELSDSEFILYDIDRAASDLVKAFLDELNRRLEVPCRILSTDVRERALDGADYVIITISTGGPDATERDLVIPERYGVFHTVGDTSGPGGWARLMRNFCVFRDLAKAIGRGSPDAMILNYSNPMTALTDVLSRLCRGPVLGLCHGLFENLEFLKRLYKLESTDEIAVKYAGLNHFFWITEARTRQRDLLADLRARVATENLTDLVREAAPDPMGFSSAHELATDLFRDTDVMPYLGDRHTCEFLSCTITDPERMAAYKLVRTTAADRRRDFQKRGARLQEMVADPATIDPMYFERSRETAADIISAHSAGNRFVDVGNVPNIGQVDNLPRGSVVETAVCIDRNGCTPLTFGPVPAAIAGHLGRWTQVFGLAVDACFNGDRQQALQALRLDPVCSQLTSAQVRELGAELLAANAKFPAPF